MAFNLEIKIKVSSHFHLRDLLKKAKAKYIGMLNQKDIYYHSGKKLLKLRLQKDRNELIKYTRNEDGKDRFSDYEILLIDGNPNFFNEIFNVESVVIKKRELWLFDNTRIHLDTVRGLGKFIELETLVINGKAEAKKRFDRMIELLKLDTTKQIRTSYKNLIIEKTKGKK